MPIAHLFSHLLFSHFPNTPLDLVEVTKKGSTILRFTTGTHCSSLCDIIVPPSSSNSHFKSPPKLTPYPFVSGS